MAYQSEIEKLEQRYQENPKQWFAALADAYRKEGSLDLALDYVRGGLEMRPNYASGYIVLGRCLVEKKEYAEAAQAFEQVLQLDAENIIALKSLSEIAEAQSDLGGAKRWLERLLEVDPMNEEAREDLDRLSQLSELPPPEVPPETEAPEAAVEEHAEAPEPPRPPEPGAAWAAEAMGKVAPVEEEPFRIEQFEEQQPFRVEATADDRVAEALGIDKDEDDLMGGEQPSVPIEGVELEAPVAAFGDVQDMAPEPLEVEHLDVGTFDDELSWGTGDSLSQEISEEDIAEAVEQHEELAAAVEFMEGMPAEEPAAGPAAADEIVVPTEGVEPGDEVPVDFGALQAIPVVSDDEFAEQTAEETSEEQPAEQDMTAGVGDEVAPAVAAGEEYGDMPEEYRQEEPVDRTVEEPIPDVAECIAPPEAFAQEPAPAEQYEEVEASTDLPLIMPDEVLAGEEEEEAPVEAEPQPVVTETMAEVYAQQGLLPEARETYEKLLERRPDDPVLQARLAELDARARSAARKKHASRYSAAETGGPAAVAFLQQVFAGEAVEDFTSLELPSEEATEESPISPLGNAFGADTSEADEAPAPGSPTVPAPDEVSLSSVFGEPVAPRPPDRAGAGSQPRPPSKGGVSFDEFYGRTTEEEAKEAEEAPPPRTSGGDGSDEEFKDWLEGLKS